MGREASDRGHRWYVHQSGAFDSGNEFNIPQQTITGTPDQSLVLESMSLALVGASDPAADIYMSYGDHTGAKYRTIMCSERSGVLSGMWMPTYNGESIQFVTSDASGEGELSVQGTSRINKNWTYRQLGAATASNASPTVVTTSLPHGLVSGQHVYWTQTGGGDVSDGWYIVTVISTTTFNIASLTGSAVNSTGDTGTVEAPQPIIDKGRFFACAQELSCNNGTEQVDFAYIPDGHHLRITYLHLGGTLLPSASRSVSMNFQDDVATAAGDYLIETRAKALFLPCNIVVSGPGYVVLQNTSTTTDDAYGFICGEYDGHTDGREAYFAKTVKTIGYQLITTLDSTRTFQIENVTLDPDDAAAPGCAIGLATAANGAGFTPILHSQNGVASIRTEVRSTGKPYLIVRNVAASTYGTFAYVDGRYLD